MMTFNIRSSRSQAHHSCSENLDLNSNLMKFFKLAFLLNTQGKMFFLYRGRFRSSHGRCSVKIVFLKISQISQENTCIGDSKKEAPTQLFSCEYCEIFKNTYFQEHLRMTASVLKILTHIR